MADDQGDAGTGQGLAERARQNREANAYLAEINHPSTPTEPKSSPYASTPLDKVAHPRPAPKGEKATYKQAVDWAKPLAKKAPVYDDGGVVDTDSEDGKKSDDSKTTNAKKVQQAESLIGAFAKGMSPHQYHEGAYGPIYDEGGKVNVNDGKHQIAILKDGERVLTPEQNKDWEHAKNLGGVSGKAPTTLPIGGKTARDANDVTPDMMPKKVYDKGGVVGEYSGQEKSEFHRAMSHLHGGALHRHFGIPEDQPIPMAKKQEAANSDNPHVAKMGHMAVAMHSWRHGKKK
jgi:hypothetical protein